MILLVDNYDSFVHNLARYLQRLGQSTVVVRNDLATPDYVRRLNPSAMVLSPGPCSPNEAGWSVELVRQFHQQLPILGVCLGHQAIGVALGGKIIRASLPMHGRQSAVTHHGDGVFAGIPSPMIAGRYHSLAVDADSLPAELQVTAWTEDRTVMALAHRELPLVGLQFHPESILTPSGYQLLANFLRLAALPIPPDVPALSDEYRDLDRKPFVEPSSPVTF